LSSSSTSTPNLRTTILHIDSTSYQTSTTVIDYTTNPCKSTCLGNTFSCNDYILTFGETTCSFLESSGCDCTGCDLCTDATTTSSSTIPNTSLQELYNYLLVLLEYLQNLINNQA
jgi:hypothetical protein